MLRDAARKLEYPPGRCYWHLAADRKPFHNPKVEKWIRANLETEVNLKSRMAAIFLRTTKIANQDGVIASYYNNMGTQAVQDKLARAVMEKLLEWEAAEGLPLLVFTASSLLEAGPDQYNA